VHREVLPNGVVVQVLPDPAVPVVAARALWRGGLLAEAAGESGLTNLLAASITRGCGGLDAEAIAVRLDDTAGSLLGFAGRSTFGLRGEWIARHVDDGLDLMADCLTSARFPADEIAREKRRVLDDLRAREDSPSQQAFRLFSETLYARHPYRLDVLGDPRSLRRLDRAAVVRAYGERYPLSALTLAVVGDVAPARVFAFARRRLGDAPVRPRRVPPIPREDFAGRARDAREVHHTLDRAQAHLVLGFPGTTHADPDRTALEVATAILGGQGGRLFAELRDRQALVYRVGAVSVEGADPGYLAIYLATSPDKLDAARAAVWRELERLRRVAPSVAELERARRYLRGSHELGLQRRSTRAALLAAHQIFGLDGDPLADYPRALARVTAADVLRVCGRTLDPALAVTATVRPPARRR
jgi:zinc protease